MEQELSLILETPIEKMVPALIGWNNAELMAAVEGTLSRYDGIVYGEGQIGEAKKDKARLNAFIKALNDERIRIGKVYTSPLDKFKGEVDEVIAKVRGVVEHIDGQVKAYDAARQEEKQNAILEYWREAVGEFAGVLPYERVHSPRWLNVTVKLPAIKTEIDGILSEARNAVTAIEALHSEDEDTIKAYYFRTLNLGDALMENERLTKERAKAAALRATHEANTSPAEETPAEMPNAVVEAPTPPSERDVPMVICFRAEGTVEQMKALRQFLIDNGIRFSRI